jgi:hypothetical protein
VSWIWQRYHTTYGQMIRGEILITFTSNHNRQKKGDEEVWLARTRQEQARNAPRWVCTENCALAPPACQSHRRSGGCHCCCVRHPWLPEETLRAPPDTTTTRQSAAGHIQLANKSALRRSSMNLSIYQSIYPCIHASIHASIHPSRCFIALSPHRYVSVHPNVVNPAFEIVRLCVTHAHSQRFITTSTHRVNT